MYSVQYLNRVINIYYSPNAAGMTMASLTEYFRTHLSEFTAGTGVTFSPYVDGNINETNRFNQPGAASLGSVVHISMPNDGTVIESDYVVNNHEAYFNFSTIESPLDFEHPVAGNRQFGVYADERSGHTGEYTFYTMGVDRTWDIVFSTGNIRNDGFDSADGLWRMVQYKMIDYIKRSGGEADFYDNRKSTARPDWDAVKEYLQNEITLAQLKQKLGC